MATIRDETVQPIPSKFMFSFKLGFDWSGYRIKDFLRKQKKKKFTKSLCLKLKTKFTTKLFKEKLILHI